MVKLFEKNDEGVSAVIGVILMVAITVILAAVIAAFVFSMSNNVGTTHTVAFTVKKTAQGTILVTNNGGADVSKLAGVTITADGLLICDKNADLKDVGASKALVPVGGATGTYAIIGTSATGTYKELTAPAGSASGIMTRHMIVTGIFTDSTSQVLIEADV